MNKLMIIIFATVFIFLSSYSPVLADGWGNTNWGMTIPQVEKATNGKLISSGEKLGGELYSHTLQDNVTIGKHNFKVYLNFANSKLDRVWLKTQADDYYDAYLYLLNEFKKKYGSPSVGPKDEKIIGGMTHVTEWATKSMVIKLLSAFISVGDLSIKVTSVKYCPKQ